MLSANGKTAQTHNALHPIAPLLRKKNDPLNEIKQTAMNQLTEYYKILQRFSSLYAGEGDDELARQAAENALNNKKFRDFKR